MIFFCRSRNRANYKTYALNPTSLLVDHRKNDDFVKKKGIIDLYRMKSKDRLKYRLSITLGKYKWEKQIKKHQ